MVLGLPLLSGTWLSVPELAKRAGVAANTVSRCENGSGAMVDTLARMQQSLEPQAWFSSRQARTNLGVVEKRPA